MELQNINLNKIVSKGIKSNSLLLCCFLITFIGFISYNIIFPKLFTQLLETVDITKENIIKTFLPFAIGQGLFCLSDKIYSRAIHVFDKKIINNILYSIVSCYENSYDERDTVNMYSNIMKLLNIKHIIHIFIEYVIPVIVITIGTFVNICTKDISLGISLLAIIGLSFVLIVSHINKNITHEDENIEYNKQLNDIILNIDKIILNNNTVNELERFKTYEDSHAEKNIHKEGINVNIKCIIALMSILILGVIGTRIVNMYNNKIINKGEFAYYFYLIIVLLQYYDSLSIELNNLLNYIHEYRKLNSYFKSIQCGNSGNKQSIQITNGDIKFIDVNISYKDKVVFENLNLDIKGNSKTGIYGRNGIGKSTIFKVLLGLHNYKGKILVDEQDISDHSISSFRNNIGFVNQHSMLFNRSIYENLKYGNNKTRIDIDKYIKDNGLQDFVSGLGGLDIIISKNGDSLSGGQRCILNIIKCILDDKKILLIDEPSNNLDKDMKKFLIDIIKNLRDKTVVIITHDSDLDSLFDNKIILS